MHSDQKMAVNHILHIHRSKLWTPTWCPCFNLLPPSPCAHSLVPGCKQSETRGELQLPHVPQLLSRCSPIIWSKNKKTGKRFSEMSTPDSFLFTRSCCQVYTFRTEVGFLWQTLSWPHSAKRETWNSSVRRSSRGNWQKYYGSSPAFPFQWVPSIRTISSAPCWRWCTPPSRWSTPPVNTNVICGKGRL